MSDSIPLAGEQPQATPTNLASTVTSVPVVGASEPAAAGAGQTFSLPRELRGWTRGLLLGPALAMVIIIFLYQPVKVEGTSMAPLLSDQERIFINKFVYRFEPIGRGEVVVFWYLMDRQNS